MHNIRHSIQLFYLWFFIKSFSSERRSSSNVIILYSQPGFYEQMLSAEPLSFTLRVLNLTDQTEKNDSIFSMLENLHDSDTLGVIAHCEDPTLMELVKIWTEDKKIYFVFFSCSHRGPSATVGNLVFQLNPNIQVYGSAITNNLEMSWQYYQSYGVGIYVDLYSDNAMSLLHVLNSSINRQIHPKTVRYIKYVSADLETQELIKQLKRSQEFSVPLIIFLCDLTLSMKIIDIVSNYRSFSSDHLINPLTTLLLTDFGTRFPISPETLKMKSDKACLSIQIAEIAFTDSLQWTYPSINDLVTLLFTTASNIKSNALWKCPPKYHILKSILATFFNEDGSAKNGPITFNRLSKKIIKPNLNSDEKISLGIWQKCRTWKISSQVKFDESLGQCDFAYEDGDKNRVRMLIQVLIELHDSVIYVTSRNLNESSEIKSNLHNVICKEFGKTEKMLCSGFAIDLLETIENDLKIDFSYLFINDSLASINEIINNSSVHMFMLQTNEDLMQNSLLDITVPFIFLEYAIMTDLSNPNPHLGAAFKPFTLSVWLMIYTIATICACSMAIYEWNSPFGLNPWGRQRDSNYTLASALTSVWAMMFGHTIHTKAPKSWPVKVLKNFWAAGCIAIVAMYTANLTVFIAGIPQNDICFFYRDGKYKAAMNRKLEGINKQLQHFNCLNLSDNSILKSKLDAEVEKLYLNKTANILIGEKKQLENFRYLNSLCKSIILPLRVNSFGYSFGFEYGSPLYKQMSHILLKYQQMGFIDLLSKSYIKQAPKCNAATDTNKIEKGYDIANMAGCFVLMGVGCAVSFWILFLEHIMFRFIVPRWRKLSEDSMWKSTSVLFFSQRLHRVIHSERLIKPKEIRREMIDIMRKREFQKVFFKENISKPMTPRVPSPAKISVFDISSEMVKMKRRSQESLVAFDNNSNNCSLEGSEFTDTYKPSETNSFTNTTAPIMSLDDSDIVLISPTNTGSLDESQDYFNVPSKYSQFKIHQKPHMKLSKDSSKGSHLSTESKNKYFKNPKLNRQSSLKYNNKRQNILSRMDCVDSE